MDAEVLEFARSFRAFADAMTAAAGEGTPELSALGQHVQDFLGTPLSELEPVQHDFPPHQAVDADVALEALLAQHGGERHGIGGVHRAHVDSFSDYLHRGFGEFRLGAAAYERRPIGPASERRVVAIGIGQVRIDGVPLVWLQRTPSPRYGREHFTVELLCADAAVAESFAVRLRQLMAELSVLRGQVISFAADDFRYEMQGAGLTFLERPEVVAEQVILPPGVLERVSRHAVSIGEHRAALRASGQHLKRGVLLYGPPGTGKTHLVRHLLSRTPGTTAVLLSGRTLHLMQHAAQLARVAQPAIVVLEDCDLVAEHRGGDTNAALFETLEAMDGLAADADITFILTTNRVDLLERALVERPGRVDLAVEIGKPDLDARRRLFRLYAADLLASGRLTEAVVETAAEATEGVTASFTKELIRRAVLAAATQEREPGDDDVTTALDEMLSDAESLTRTLLGGDGTFPDDDGGDGPMPAVYRGPRGPRPGRAPGGVGWFAYSPG